MADTELLINELGLRLDDGIKEAFTFPFTAEEHCHPDGMLHFIAPTTFHLNDHFVVLHNIRLFPGLTFRALKVSTGDLNVFTQDVEFEIDVPTIGGCFYTVTDDKSVKPVHKRGSFKINYATVIAKGITNFFLNSGQIEICNIAMDFELVEQPKVKLYSNEANDSLGPFDSNVAENGTRVAQVLWPSVKPLLYWVFRDKLGKMGAKIQWGDRFGRIKYERHEKWRRRIAGDGLTAVITRMQRKLKEKTNSGRLPMPDIDVMVASKEMPDVWGRFKATSGWLGNVTSMRVREHTPVHARSKNELVIIGQIYFNYWQYCYEKFEMDGNMEKVTGKLFATLENNEALITITVVRNDEGTIVVKNGKFEYIKATRNDYEVKGNGNLSWMEKYVKCWMSGLMEEGKPALNKTINDSLNEVLEDAEIFPLWDQLYEQGFIDGNPITPDDHSTDGEYDYSEEDSDGESNCDDWENSLISK